MSAASWHVPPSIATTGHESYRHGLLKLWIKRLAYLTAGLALLLVLVVLTERIRGQ